MSASPSHPSRLTFRAASRIKRGRDFAILKERGARFAVGCLVLNCNSSAARGSRLGLITSKRVGSAVARNRARRLLRESYRKHQLELNGPMDIVLIARPSIAGKQFQHVERDFLTAAAKAGLMKKPADGSIQQ